MRELKFRGKRVDNNEWAYGYYVRGVRGGNIQSYIQDIERSYKEINPETLGQFYWKQDKNGTDIYEGDILEIWDIQKFETRQEAVDVGELQLTVVRGRGEIDCDLLEGSHTVTVVWFLEDVDIRIIGNKFDGKRLK